MTKTRQRSIRLTSEVEARAIELAKLWKPDYLTTEISFADVVATCVNRIYEQDTKKTEKRR